MSQGPGETLRLIRSGEATTRGELLEATGLSRVTVARRIDGLLRAGIIRESGRGSATGGRRATTFVFDPDVVVLAAALDAVGGEVAVMSPHGGVRARAGLDAAVAEGPERTLGLVGDALRALLARAGIDRSRVVAVAISLPGPTDPVAHRLFDPPIMPGWSGWPIVETLRDAFDVPVYVENDADAMAYGEASDFGPHESLVLVKASAYIGAGLVVDGRIFRGSDGGAGDIGHVLVGGAARCRCGRVGCLAAEASGAALLARLREHGIELDDVRQVHDLVEHGDATVAAELRRAGELIGQVLATVVGVLNPGHLVIGGTMASLPLIATIRSAVYSGSLPRATRNLDIRPARLGDDAAFVGLTRVAIDDVYSVEAVNARLDTEG